MVTAPPFAALLVLTVARKLQPCLFEQLVTNVELATGRGRVDIIACSILSMGLVPTSPLFASIEFFALLGRVVRLVPPLPRHPVVSLQDPLNRVIRLLTAEGPSLRVISTVLSLLTCLWSLLPLALLPGGLQNAFSEAPSCRQVVVEAWTFVRSLLVALLLAALACARWQLLEALVLLAGALLLSLP